ncbi:MAG: hypothetical protein BWY82_02501 [Verrucomicrobia bacterium ADurb.Bin474]|nr:MAG: hypothetical protein BWY82_02501 [Verrucomicrobia bacterium ADurb.Bin474]
MGRYLAPARTDDTERFDGCVQIAGVRGHHHRNVPTGHERNRIRPVSEGQRAGELLHAGVAEYVAQQLLDKSYRCPPGIDVTPPGDGLKSFP